MATFTYKGRAMPLAVNLEINAGDKPNGRLIISDAKGSRMPIDITFEELRNIVSALKDDDRFTIDTKKWTEVNRQTYDEQLDEYLRSVR